MAFRFVEINTFGLLNEEINMVFRGIQRLDQSGPRGLEAMEIPPVDIYETEEAVFVELEVPGIDPDSVQVYFTGGSLVVEGLKEEKVTRGRLNYICMERSFGNFQRIVPINGPIDLAASEGQYHQGILSIRLIKIPERRGRSDIKIKRIRDKEK